MSEINTNWITFEEGLERIRQTVGKQFDQQRKIVTSRDSEVAPLTEKLRVPGLPAGFIKWQLPVYLNGPSQLFISVAAPHSEAGEHSHDAGDGIRFIVSGSINYAGKELTAGDWMYIPQGKRYGFRTGPLGAVMCYCYCCCCVPRQN